MLCTLQALRLDQKVPWRFRWLAGAALGYLLLYEFTRQAQGHLTLRMAFVPFVALILLLQVVAWAWRTARRQQSVGALAIAGAHLLLAGSMVYILAGLLLPRSGALACTRDNSSLMDTVGLLAALASDVGFIGIALERSVRGWQEAAATQARLEERQLLGNQLAHLDRQRGFGLVAASLAHELNQPLTAILASAQAAQRGTAADRLDRAQGLELLDKIIHNTRRLSEVTGRIRSFIRPAEPHPGPVDLEKVTREMLELVEPDLQGQDVQVAFSGGGEPVLVQGDTIQLSQVVLNVLRNALEAVQWVPERSLHIQLTRSAGEAVLSIRDSGPGLDPELTDRIGTPYFTTKPDGLGLGLSIAIAILQQHQGSLTLHNAEGGGACVDIRLPLLAVGGSPS
jgi:signal transduction histidine kinase